MPPMRLLLAPLLLILAACGGGGGDTPRADVTWMTVIAYQDAPPGVLAYTTADKSEVWVIDALTLDQKRHAFAHELWHVAGFHEHLGDATCIAFGAETTVDSPCPMELAAMMDVTETFHLLASFDAYEPALWAVLFWNSAVGRTMFVLEVP